MTIDAAGTSTAPDAAAWSPDDPIDVVEQVGAAYDIRWLVLERDQIVDVARTGTQGTSRPAWIGPPASLSSRRRPDASRSIPPIDDLPGLALSPIRGALRGRTHGARRP